MVAMAAHDISPIRRWHTTMECSLQHIGNQKTQLSVAQFDKTRTSMNIGKFCPLPLRLLKGKFRVYIYIYTYMCCEVIIWAKFGQFECYYLGQVCSLTNTVCQKRYKIGVSTLFLTNKSCGKFLTDYLAQVGHFYVAPNLAQIITFTWPR